MEGEKRGSVRCEGEISRRRESGGRRRRAATAASFFLASHQAPHAPPDLPCQLRESDGGKRCAFESKGHGEIHEPSWRLSGSAMEAGEFKRKKKVRKKEERGERRKKKLRPLVSTSFLTPVAQGENRARARDASTDPFLLSLPREKNKSAIQVNNLKRFALHFLVQEGKNNSSSSTTPASFLCSLLPPLLLLASDQKSSSSSSRLLPPPPPLEAFLNAESTADATNMKKIRLKNPPPPTTTEGPPSRRPPPPYP